MTKIKYKDKFIKIVSTPKADNNYWVFNEHIKKLIKPLYFSLLETYTYTKNEINKFPINIPTHIERIFERVFDKFIKKYELKFFINNYFIGPFMKTLKKLFIEEIASNIKNQFPNFLDKAELLARQEKLLENYAQDILDRDNSLTQKNLKLLVTTREAIETIINGIFNIIENSKSGRLLISVCKVEKLKQYYQAFSSQEVSRDSFLGILNLYINQIPNLIKNFGKQYLNYTSEKDFTEEHLVFYSNLPPELEIFNLNNPRSKEILKETLQEANKEALSAMLNSSSNDKTRNNVIAENVSSWVDLVSLGRIRRTCREAAGYSSCITR